MLSLNGRSGGVTVAVDAMGGDHAPHETVKGAVDAYRQGLGVVLVGDHDQIAAELDAYGEDIPVVHASEAVSMDEGVGQAVRRDDSSLAVAARLVEDGHAQAAVSCGNSGAIMAIALRTFGRLPGIERPAFGSYLPTPCERVFVLDIGANASVKASHLLQFAIMGSVYVQVDLGIAAPRVGLLSNGTEDSKGTKEVKEANELLRKHDLNFVGNVEGNQIFDGSADVVVCDGFTGNVLLKTGEGVAQTIFTLLKQEISKDLVSRLGAAVLMPTLTRIKRRTDYEEYGGAAVLGVNHVMINCHGRSSAKAVTNAVILANRMARERLVTRIGEALHEDSEVGRRRRIVRALHLSGE